MSSTLNFDRNEVSYFSGAVVSLLAVQQCLDAIRKETGRNSLTMNELELVLNDSIASMESQLLQSGGDKELLEMIRDSVKDGIKRAEAE